jgi:uncharacterized protein DUF6069
MVLARPPVLATSGDAAGGAATLTGTGGGQAKCHDETKSPATGIHDRPDHGPRAGMLVGMLNRLLALVRADFAPRHRQPLPSRVLLATLGSIAGSLAADAILVVIGQAVFPATRGYPHFQFGDYAKLTVIGVIIACVGWPVVTRLTSEPRWLFFRLAILVTLVLWLPDLYILHGGAPVDAVAVLMLMHVAIALVTYNVLVRVAPTGPGVPSRTAPQHARQ